LGFGHVPPGERRTWKGQVQIPKDARDRVDQLSFAFRAAGKIDVSAPPVTFRVVAADRPVFAYSHQLADCGNVDGLIQRGETHRLWVTIKNTGTGTAEEPSALLRNASGDGILLKKARFGLGQMRPGDAKSVEFEFT